jgi:hypothetical protein
MRASVRTHLCAVSCCPASVCLAMSSDARSAWPLASARSLPLCARRSSRPASQTQPDRQTLDSRRSDAQPRATTGERANGGQAHLLDTDDDRRSTRSQQQQQQQSGPVAEIWAEARARCACLCRCHGRAAQLTLTRAHRSNRCSLHTHNSTSPPPPHIRLPSPSRSSRRRRRLCRHGIRTLEDCWRLQAAAAAHHGTGARRDSRILRNVQSCTVRQWAIDRRRRLAGRVTSCALAAPRRRASQPPCPSLSFAVDCLQRLVRIRAGRGL